MDGTARPHPVAAGHGPAILDAPDMDADYGRQPGGPVSPGQSDVEPVRRSIDADGALIPWSRHAAMATNGIICSLMRQDMRRRRKR